MAEFFQSGLGGGSSLPSSTSITNLGLAASVAASAMTVSLKEATGADPSMASPVVVQFRNSTQATGTPSQVTIVGALSTAISSGSTFGTVSGGMSRVYVYLLNNAGTAELALAGSNAFDENAVVSTTAEGGAGAADSSVTMYSTTARSNVAFRYIGFIESTQATAGTWASSPSRIGIFTESYPKSVANYKYSASNGYASGNTHSYRFTNTDRSFDVNGLLNIPNSSTLGTPVTAYRRCRVTMTVTDNFNLPRQFGITLNADLTIDLSSVPLTNVLQISRTSGDDQESSLTITTDLDPGSYLNFQNNKNTAGATVAQVQMYVFAEEL